MLKKRNILVVILCLLLTVVLFACDQTPTEDSTINVPPDIPTINPDDDYGLADKNINSNISYDSNTYAPYEIYPVPHSIKYVNEYYFITHEVNVVFESGIDAATKDHLYETIALKNMNGKPSNEIKSSKNILVGIYDSNEVVDKHINSDSFETLFTKIDAYYLAINKDNIIILGKDSDACFYAITTLQWIFEQTTTTIKGLVIEDYSDSYYRGFIEGYYGIPWTTDERIELMEYGSKVKSNIYIYAPKDDSYHSSNWRALYDQSDLLGIKEIIDAGIKSKTRFAWSIHPFISDPITTENYEEDYAALINKFEQLYENGVRQFVISADDVYVSDTEEYDVAVQTRLLNDVSEWLRDKGDCYKLVFVPSAYCTIAQESLNLNLFTYFEKLCDGLDPDVEIMWTGALICSSVENGDFDLFTELTGRKAFMWMNWPVNDYCMDALIMSKGEVLNKRIAYNEELQFTGIVVNPMQQAEPSKLSIFAVSDYCWNINDFDVDRSYEASLPSLEPTATDSFSIIVNHLANGSTFEGEYFEESTKFKPYVNGFEERYLSGDLSDIDDLITLFNEVIAACDDYLLNASNLELKESIKPWVDSLKLLCEQSILYLEVLKDPNAENALELYEEATKYNDLRKDCKAPILDIYSHNMEGKTVRLSISTLTPFVETLDFLAKDEVYLSNGLYSGVVYRGFKAIYEGELENIIDGDKDSYVWFEDHPYENGFIRIDLGQVMTITDIKLLQGNGSNYDALVGIVEVSLDGRTFTPVGRVYGLESIVDLRLNPVEARYVRLVNDGSYTWVAIREFEVNTLPELTKIVTCSNLELEGTVITSIYNMCDDNMDTFTWFTRNTQENATIILDLLEVKSVSHIGLYMSKSTSPNDYFHHYEVFYSNDGEHYTTLGEHHLAEFDHYFDGNVDVRYVKVVAVTPDEYGIVIREITADNKVESKTISTNATLYQGVLKNIIDDNNETYAWIYPGDDLKVQDKVEVILDLREIKTVNNIFVVFSSEASENDYLQGYKLSYSTDGINYIDLVLVEPNDPNVRNYIYQANIDARYIKLSGTADITNWIKLYEFNID